MTTPLRRTARLNFNDDTDTTLLSFGHLSLTAERREELIGRLTDLIDEFSTAANTGDPAEIKQALFIAAHEEPS